MARRFQMIDEAGDGKVRIIGAEAVNESPQRFGITRTFGPAGEKCAAIGMGQTDPQVEDLARGSGYTAFLTRGEVVLGLCPRIASDC